MVFYDNKEAGRTQVRFTFCKRPEVLKEGLARLAAARLNPGVTGLSRAQLNLPQPDPSRLAVALAGLAQVDPNTAAAAGTPEDRTPQEDKTQMDPALLRAAEAAAGFMPADEGQALYETALAYAPVGPVMEIGSYCGKSTIYLAAAARQSARRCSPSITTTGPRSTRRAGSTTTPRWSTRARGGSTRCRASGPRSPPPGWKTTSSPSWAGPDRVAQVWRGLLGLVFIDGGHTDEAAQADYEGWAPKVTLGGALAIHDVFPDPADGGQAPYRVYQRALESGEFTEVRAAGSLRVLERILPSTG